MARCKRTLDFGFDPFENTQLGKIIINGHSAPAILHPDGRIESGPTANRLASSIEAWIVQPDGTVTVPKA